MLIAVGALPISRGRPQILRTSKDHVRHSFDRSNHIALPTFRAVIGRTAREVKYGHFWFFILVLPEWIEHSTSPLPRGCAPLHWVSYRMTLLSGQLNKLGISGLFIS